MCEIQICSNGPQWVIGLFCHSGHGIGNKISLDVPSQYVHINTQTKKFSSLQENHLLHMERLQNIFLILILVLGIHVFYSFLVLFFAPDIETIYNKIENKTENTRKIHIICFISHTHPPPPSTFLSSSDAMMMTLMTKLRRRSANQPARAAATTVNPIWWYPLLSSTGKSVNWGPTK